MNALLVIGIVANLPVFAFQLWACWKHGKFEHGTDSRRRWAMWLPVFCAACLVPYSMVVGFAVMIGWASARWGTDFGRWGE